MPSLKERAIDRLLRSEGVALVGRTGAGKSSLVHLLAGLYAPWSGDVYLAGLNRFVTLLPQGYDTQLSGVGGGKGVQLSDGQEQLRSLARALVWDPAVLLLDEATAAVDYASESEFRTA